MTTTILNNSDDDNNNQNKHNTSPSTDLNNNINNQNKHVTPEQYNKLIQQATNNPFAVLQSQEEEEAAILASQLLNAKQIKFCENYIQTFNAAKAAADAGYSVRSAASIGYALLRRPDVQAYIESLRQINSHKYRHSILDELHDLYLQAKAGDIVYERKTTPDGITIATPIMAQHVDGTIAPLRDKPNYKIALESLRTMAEYTIPKPTTPISPTDKLAIANKYIQNNTYINNNNKPNNKTYNAITDHINNVIHNNNQ